MKMKYSVLLGLLLCLLSGFTNCTDASVGRTFKVKECFKSDLLPDVFDVQGPVETTFPLGTLAKLSGKSVQCANVSKQLSGSSSELKKCYLVTMTFMKDEVTTNFNFSVDADKNVSSVVELVGLGASDPGKIIPNYNQLEKLVLSEIDKEGCLVPDGEVTVKK